MTAIAAPPRDYAQIALDYASDVVAGRILACKWVRLACERQLRDLERVGTPDFPYVFDETRGAVVCQFVELFPHTKGKWAGKLITLEPWQIFRRMVLFGWVHAETHLRRFRKAYTCVPRKNGKSIDAAGDGNYMFAADGENGAEVYSGATTEKQAWEVFRPARLMALKTPDFLEQFGVEVGASNMNIPGDGSRFEPVIGKPGDGASPSCAIIDEYHEHETDSLVDTMETGMGAREQPLIDIITTAGSNLESPCYQLQLDVQDMLEGSKPNDQLFGIIYTIDLEEHEVRFQSSRALQRLDSLCTCLGVPTTQIETFAREAFAKRATIASVARTSHGDASTTRIDLSEPGSSAAGATNNSFSTETPSGSNAASTSDQSGPIEIGPKSEHPTLGGANASAPGRSSTRSGSPSMASADESTTHDSKRRAENAQSATELARLYAWITATQAAASAASSVASATPQSAFSEILSRTYAAHSTTCAARRARVDRDTLIVREPADDWTSELALRKANPNYDVSVSADFLKMKIRDAVQSARKQNTIKTKHLNIWCTARSAWMNMEAWHACKDETLRLDAFEGARCWLALDLSSKLDVAANVRVFRREESDGATHYYAFGRFYLPESRASDPARQTYQGWMKQGLLTVTDGDVIDYAQIQADILEDGRRFEVAEVIFDPWGATKLQQDIATEGFTIVDYPQTTPKFSEPMKELEALVIAKRFHHDGNPILTWMMSNVTVKPDAKDNIFPRKDRAESKIDGAVALIMGTERARVSADDGWRAL